MKYIIDPTIPFTGAVITSMSDDIHSDYGGETLEELKVREKNPNLVAVDPDKVTELVNEHRRQINKEPFKEIDEERYEDLFECLPPFKMWHDMFFVGECYQYDIYPFCFKIEGRFFTGKRSVTIPADTLRAEIHEFYDNLIKAEADGNKS